jgi:hypothetical protein
LREPETGRHFCHRNLPSPPAETGNDAPARANVGEIRGFFQRPQETKFARNCVVAQALRRNQSPTPNSLLNREINREFFDFGPFWAILASNRRANSDGYNEIPYATEQGIISAEEGMFLREQGISAKHQGSGIRGQFRAGGNIAASTEIAFAMDRHPLVERSCTEQAVSARARASGAGATNRPGRRTSGRRRSRVAADLRRRP